MESSRGEFWARWRENTFLEARGKEVTDDEDIEILKWKREKLRKLIDSK